MAYKLKWTREDILRERERLYRRGEITKKTLLEQEKACLEAEIADMSVILKQKAEMEARIAEIDTEIATIE